MFENNLNIQRFHLSSRSSESINWTLNYKKSLQGECVSKIKSTAEQIERVSKVLHYPVSRFLNTPPLLSSYIYIYTLSLIFKLLVTNPILYFKLKVQEEYSMISVLILRKLNENSSKICGSKLTTPLNNYFPIMEARTRISPYPARWSAGNS